MFDISERTIENAGGVTRDESDSTTFFAEDFLELRNALIAVGKSMTPGEPHADATNPESHTVIGNEAITGNTDSGDDTGHIAIGEGASTQVSSSGDMVGLTAIGYNATASGNSVTVLGSSASASGIYSVAVGRSAEVSSNYASALGPYSGASGDYATAIGSYADASGNYSTAIGRLSSASGVYAIAFGRSSEASSDYAFALGSFSSATGFGAVALGYAAKALQNDSVAVGFNSLADYECSLAFGREAATDKANQLVVGSSDYPINEVLLGVQSSGVPLIFADESGVGIGKTSPAYKLDVAGNGRFKSSDQPVLDLTQDDNDKAFIRLEGAAETGNLSASLVDSDDVSSSTIEGYLEIEVDDRENQITSDTYYIPFYNLS